MKLISNFILISLIISLHSCCKQTGYPIAEVDIQYTTTYPSFTVYDIRTSKTDFTDIIDTLRLHGERVYQHDPYTHEQIYFIRIVDGIELYNHILIPIDGSRVDTMSRVNILRDNCDDVEGIEYYWNDRYSTDTYKEVN